MLEPDPEQTLVILNMIFNNEALSESLQRLMVISSKAFQTLFMQEEYHNLLAEFEFIWSEQQQEFRTGSDLLRKGALERTAIHRLIISASYVIKRQEALFKGIIHGATPNPSPNRRCGYTMRYFSTEAKVYPEKNPDF